METKISAQYQRAQEALTLLWNNGEESSHPYMDLETFRNYLNLVYRKCIERLLDETDVVGSCDEAVRDKAGMICQFLERIEYIVEHKEG